MEFKESQVKKVGLVEVSAKRLRELADKLEEVRATDANVNVDLYLVPNKETKVSQLAFDFVGKAEEKKEEKVEAKEKEEEITPEPKPEETKKEDTETTPKEEAVEPKKEENVEPPKAEEKPTEEAPVVEKPAETIAEAPKEEVVTEPTETVVKKDEEQSQEGQALTDEEILKKAEEIKAKANANLNPEKE